VSPLDGSMPGSIGRFSFLHHNRHLQAPVMAIRQCLSSGGCLREKIRPEDDFIDVRQWVGGVKAVLLGNVRETWKKEGRQAGRIDARWPSLSPMLNVTKSLQNLRSFQLFLPTETSDTQGN
jgi:hypothetical protein